MADRDLTLVVGATGLLGTRIVKLLREANRPVRALVRHDAQPSKRAMIVDCGAEVVGGDLKAPDSLAAACRGVTTVISTASATLSYRDNDSIGSVDEAGQLSLVDAAARAGVARFVFVSFPPRKLDYALQRAKRAVEARLESSGLAFTVLQSVSFMEVWLSSAVGFDLLGGRVHLLGTGTQPVSWISIQDVARFAVAASEGDRFSREIVPLGGPDPLSPLDVVAMFEEMGGDRVTLTNVSESALEARLASARDPREEAYAAIMLAVARGLAVVTPPAVGLLPGRMTTVRQHVEGLINRSESKEREGRK